MVISATNLSFWITVNSTEFLQFDHVYDAFNILCIGYVLEKRHGQNSDVEVSDFVVRAEFQKFSNR